MLECHRAGDDVHIAAVDTRYGRVSTAVLVDSSQGSTSAAERKIDVRDRLSVGPNDTPRLSIHRDFLAPQNHMGGSLQGNKYLVTIVVGEGAGDAD